MDLFIPKVYFFDLFKSKRLQQTIYVVLDTYLRD